MPAFEILEHTADTGVRAFGSSPKEVFANAALGMFSLITDVERVNPERSVEIEVTADDRESLLVEWLNELLYRFEVDGFVFGAFDIEELGDNHVKAIARGEPIDPDRHELGIQIKACTYHELRIEEIDGGWVAQVIFDV